MRITRSPIVALILLVAVEAIAANTKSKPKKPTKAAPQKVSLNAESLRAGFGGESVGDVFSLFTTPPKGEFESTLEYDRRLSNLPFGTYAIRTEASALIYDADAQMIRVEIKNEEDYGDDEGRRRYEFDGSPVPTGTYVGQNAYGAKATVDTSRVSRYRITDRRSNRDSQESLSGAFPLERDIARRMKPTLRVLLLVNVDADAARSIEHDQRTRSATVASPYEFTIHEYRITAEVLGFWVVDGKTGQIIYRSDQTSLEPDV